MQQIQFVQVTPEQLQNAIIEGVKTQLQDLKRHFEPKSPSVYLTRLEVAEMLQINISSVHNYTKRKILTAWQIGGRVYYKRDEVEKAIVKLEN